MATSKFDKTLTEAAYIIFLEIKEMRESEGMTGYTKRENKTDKFTELKDGWADAFSLEKSGSLKLWVITKTKDEGYILATRPKL